MNAIVFVVLVALVILVLSGLKTDRVGDRYVSDLKSGRLFQGFVMEKYTRSHDSVLALDVKNRRVGFARATYFSDRHGDRKHVPVTIAVDLNEIKNIHLIGTIGNKGASYTFEFHRPIPPENDSCSLSMVGNPGEIDVLVEEITSLLRDHHA